MAKARPAWAPAVLASVALLLVPCAALLWFALRTPPKRRATPTVAPRTRTAARAPRVDTGDGARRVEGTVVDERGAPVAGAEVRVLGGRGRRGRTGADGRFALSSVRLDALRIQARASGYELAELRLDPGQAGDRETLTFTLAKAGAVSGTVVDPEGKPVARANVVCTDRPPQAKLVTQTSASGRFELPSTAADCEAEASARGFTRSEAIPLRSGTENRLTLRRGASIAGEVVDERGAALTRYRVAVESFRPLEGRGGIAVASDDVDDPSGRFTLRGLAPGQYVLTAAADGRAPTHSDPIELGEGERKRGVRLVLTPGAVLEGVVRDPSGAPIAGARVSLDLYARTVAGRPGGGRADESGRYTVEGVPKGPFSVRVQAPGYDSRVVAGIRTEGTGRVSKDFELSLASDAGRPTTEYTGVGLMLSTKPNGVVVGGVVGGGPAEAAGLQRGDRVVRIDGKWAAELSMAQCAQLLRGEEGTRVSLTVARGDTEKQVVLTRSTFKR